jgi:hypothetical protein
MGMLEKKQDSNRGVRKVFGGTNANNLRMPYPHQNSEAYLQNFLGNRKKV